MADEGLPVQAATRVLAVTDSGYYAWKSRGPSARAVRHALVTETIRQVHLASRSLPHRATPATAYAARPKATPGTHRDRDTHDRVRTDRNDSTGCVTLRLAGRLHHIGIGRTRAGTHVLLLVQDRHVRSSTPPPASCCAS